MQRKNFKNQNASGQAIIEFTLGLLLSISFFFFYVKLAAIFAVGNYIHYATFMAARTYQASAKSEPDQKTAAEDVLRSMIGSRWKNLIKPTGGDSAVKGGTIGGGTFYSDDRFINSWNQGVTFSFKPSVSLYPWDKVAPPIVMSLVSESWTGREEPTDVCLTKKGKIKGQLNSATSNNVSNVYWENGNDGC